MNAKDIMTRPVVSASPGHSVRHAAQIMLDHKISGLPVIGDEGQIVGILSEGDLMRRMELGGIPVGASELASNRSEDSVWSYVRNHSWRVDDLMSRDVICVEENAPLHRIAEIMQQNGFKRVPVIRLGKLVGMIARTDLLRAIVASPAQSAIRGDEALKRAIEARLSFDLGLSPSQVSVLVEDRQVTLEGAVESEALREAARVAAEGVRGCEAVANAVQVVRPDTPSVE